MHAQLIITRGYTAGQQQATESGDKGRGTSGTSAAVPALQHDLVDVVPHMSLPPCWSHLMLLYF
jgi:hypothetical protein